MFVRTHVCAGVYMHVEARGPLGCFNFGHRVSLNLRMTDSVGQACQQTLEGHPSSPSQIRDCRYVMPNFSDGL